jgi:hypothetical protein
VERVVSVGEGAHEGVTNDVDVVDIADVVVEE